MEDLNNKLAALQTENEDLTKRLRDLEFRLMACRTARENLALKASQYKELYNTGLKAADTLTKEIEALKKPWAAPKPVVAETSMLVNSALFLSLLERDGLISRYVKYNTLGMLRWFVSQTANLIMPRIGAGPNNMVGLTWENKDHHLNIEFFDNGSVEVWYECLSESDPSFEFLEKHKHYGNISPEALKKLEYFIS